MEFKFTKIDKLKRLLLALIVSILFFSVFIAISLIIIGFLFKEYLFILMWIFSGIIIVLSVTSIVVMIVAKLKAKEALKSKYLFDMEENKENIKTSFKDCILQEVEFQKDGFIFRGDKVSYSEVKFEYSIYGNNIMLHIYLKDEEVNPLLIFIVDEELYFCAKKFDLNLQDLNKEINMLKFNM